MPLDLVLRQARIAGSDGPRDIGISTATSPRSPHIETDARAMALEDNWRFRLR
jgi:hypothetical protein